MIEKIKSFLLENKTTRQTVAKNTFWLTVSNVGGRLLRAIIILYGARVLGAANWGVFSYALSLAAFLTIFTDFGIGPLLTRETSKAEGDKNRLALISTSFFVKIGLLFLSIIVIVLFVPYLTTIEEVKDILFLVAMIVAFDLFREFGASLIRATDHMEIEAGLYLLTNLAIVVFGFFALRLEPTTLSLTYAYAAGTAVGMLATLFVLRRELRGIFRNFNRDLVRPMFMAAFPFAMSGILGGLMINTDILVLGYFHSAETVGLYSASQRLIQLLYLIPTILAVSTFPTFSRLAVSNNEHFRNILEKIIGFCFLLSLPIAIGGILFAKEILILAFGADFIGATLSLQLLLLTILVNFSAVVLSNAIFAYNGQKILLWGSLLGALSNLVFDLLLIPQYGLAGAALATLVVQLIFTTYLWIQMLKFNTFTVLPHLKRIAVGTIVMSILAFFLPTTGWLLIPSILLAALSYFVLLYLLREPLLHEIRLILKPNA